MKVVWLVGLSILGIIALAAVGVWYAVPDLLSTGPPIRVGLLHSRTGTLKISEDSMVDAETLAIEEINARGGVLGRRVVAVVADGRSDPAQFAAEAARLIDRDKVDVIVGCWTSSCRKAVKPVVEKAGHLLLYPVAYEGLEQSPAIVYTGAAPNQQVIPTVKWCLDVLKAKRFFLIGSDTVWPHSVNEIIKDQLKAFGATTVGEAYLPFGTSDVAAALDSAAAARPDLVLSTIEGDTNLPFYKKLRSSPGSAYSQLTVLSYSITEDELRELPAREMTHDYIVCNYFQAIDREENRAFVARFKKRFGSDRVTCDAIATAYNSLMLWAQGVQEVGTTNLRDALPSLLRQSLNAPEGIISVDAATQHTYRPFFVGKVRGDGQVDIVFSIDKPIRPDPFPFSRPRREWEEFARNPLAAPPSRAARVDDRPTG